MNTNQTGRISPWKPASSKHRTESCDQNMNSDSKSPDRTENSSSALVSDMNDINRISSPTTRFTIRSSVSADSPCNGDGKLEQSNQNGDESERINFSAAFNMFESCTLPRDNKNKRNFTIPKYSSAKDNRTRKESDSRTSDSETGQSPSVHGTTDANYYTLPGSPKKSSTSIILSPSSDSLHRNKSTHSEGNENTDLISPNNTSSGSATIRVVPQSLFRSHAASIVPNPPPQASFSPSNNIQWPLRNKNKNVLSPVKKSQGFSAKTADEVNELSSWRQNLSPVRNTVHERLADNNSNQDISQTTTSTSEAGVHSSNDAGQNGFAKAVSTSTPSKASPVLKSEHTPSVNGETPNSPQTAITEKSKEIRDASSGNTPPVTERLTNGKHPLHPDSEKSEPSSNSEVFRVNELASQKTGAKEKAAESINEGVVPEQSSSESVIKAEVTDKQHSGTTAEKVINEEKSVSVKSAVAPSGDVQTIQSGSANQTTGEFTDDEKIKDKLTLRNWDPRPLLDDLYQLKLEPDTEDEFSYINMEGYMEKLPTNKKKATLLKTWKRRYFKAKEGKLYYFETRQHAQEAELCLVEAETAYWEENSSAGEKASAYFQMMGGSVEELGGRMLGIDDGRGRYLVVRCPTENEYNDWLKSLNSQVNGRIESTFVKPVLSSAPHREKKIVIIDIGSCSVRAGILGEKPSLPSVFFPTVIAVDKNTGEQVFGFDCYKPEVRATANIFSPVRPSSRMDKSVDMSVMSGLFRKIYNELGVNPKKYWVMFSAPGNLSDKLKEQFMDILVKEYLVPGVNIVNQTLLALYSYNAKTGIVVDIGDRLEIVPITDGYVAEGGVTRQPYGGHRVAEALKGALTERKYHFFTEAEYPLVRLIMEKLCFVSEDFNQDLTECNRDPKYFQETLSLEGYNLPEGYSQEVTLDWGRFKAPEGLFNTEVWGMDNPPLQKLVQKAIQASPLDSRREMWRSIYLSGGATIIPGFAARLQAELTKIAPTSIVVQVHASPQRYHAAYIGACTLASLPPFERSCITSEEWHKQGAKTLKRWHMY